MNYLQKLELEEEIQRTSPSWMERLDIQPRLQLSCISWLDTIAANLPSFDQIFQGVDDKSMYGKTMALMEIVSLLDWWFFGWGWGVKNNVFQFGFPL
jgi:hypothetical protein